MSASFTDAELELVFGKDSDGNNPAARSKASKSMFVRGQVQLAPYNERATGRVLSAAEAYRAFGWSTLLQAVTEGSAPLVSSPDEPARTLRIRRAALGLSEKEVANRAEVPVAVVQQAETKGAKTPIRTLEKLAQLLSLDERKLGLSASTGLNNELAVRLRDMASSQKTVGFTSSTVLHFSEAAWVVARQAELQKILAEQGFRLPNVRQQPCNDLRYPVYQVGYRLAKSTRDLLGIDPLEPIRSVRALIEDKLNLPLVQLKMSGKLAGATISSGGARGILVNEVGMNSNVWVRRMTLCHELGHLLWDPDEHLLDVTVDAYSEIELSADDIQSRRGSVEARANAFAIAFLAPPPAVEEIASHSRDPRTVVSEVMRTFGISATAAKHHVSNIAKIDTRAVGNDELPEPETHWSALENLTVDYMPIEAMLSRRGKFAWYVAKAYALNELTLDSAASLLGVPTQEVTAKRLADISSLRDNP